MSRHAGNTKRKAAAIQVPALELDAAERKRVLNVLAQRRYRERKREHLKRLESQAESSPSSLSGQEASATCSEHAQPTSYQPQETIRNSTPVCVPVSPALNIFVNPVAPGELVNSLFGDSGCIPDSFDPVLPTWPGPMFLPSLLASPITTPTTDPSSSEQTPDTDTSPSSSDSVDWAPIQDMDLLSTLQTMSTRTYTFPDERHTNMLELKLLRGCMMIAKRLNIEDLLWSFESTSPFTDPSLAGLAFDHLPINLRPTKTQQLIPHHPMFDILVWPSVRDKLILVFSQDPELRPPVAASPTAMLDLVYDIEDSAEGVRIWGDDPCLAESWEVGAALFNKWWWSLDKNIIGRSNELRRERGAPLLGRGCVLGEV